MPAKSRSQQRAAGADVARCERGETPKTFGDCQTAREFARTGSTKRLPERKGAKR